MIYFLNFFLAMISLPLAIDYAQQGDTWRTTIWAIIGLANAVIVTVKLGLGK